MSDKDDEKFDNDRFAWTSTSDDNSDSELNVKMVKSKAEKNKPTHSFEDEGGSETGIENFKQELDITQKKKKKKKESLKENGSMDHIEDSDNDKYLDLKVKQERNEEYKKNKIKPHSAEHIGNGSLDLNVKSEHKAKKKKKDKDMEQIKEEVASSEEDGYLARRLQEEHTAEGRRESSSPSCSRRSSSSRNSSPSGSRSTCRSSRSHTRSHSSAEGPGSPKSAFQQKRKSTIAEKIVFEDDVLGETDTSASGITEHLKSYIRQSRPLETLSPKEHSMYNLSPHENLWLVHCPTEVDIDQIKAIDLGAESKPKMKVQGHAYEGTIEKNNMSVPILTTRKNKHVVTRIRLEGEIRFRKRVPRANAAAHESSEPNNACIPLPQTKRRHPLFGANFKAAAKIPRAIAERLHHARDKGQHRKRKASAAEPQAQGSPSASPQRKRRRSQAQPSWDSAEGIEDSLFNF